MSPCAACKLLRRRCAQDCVFAPYFPANEPHKFASVHRVFGASNVNKMLQVFNSQAPLNVLSLYLLITIYIYHFIDTSQILLKNLPITFITVGLLGFLSEPSYKFSAFVRKIGCPFLKQRSKPHTQIYFYYKVKLITQVQHKEKKYQTKKLHLLLVSNYKVTNGYIVNHPCSLT